MKRLLLYIWADLRPVLKCALGIYIVLGWWWVAGDIVCCQRQYDRMFNELYDAQQQANDLSLRLQNVECRQKNGESLWVHNPVRAAKIAAKRKR